MKAYFKEIIDGTWSLFVGMAITLRYFFQPVVTLRYPYESLTMTPRYRGHIELVPEDRKGGGHKCIFCGMCQRNCPSGCITLVGERKEGSKRKELTGYMLDFTKCSLCGQCIENCPTSAIDFSKEYNLAGFSRGDFQYDLLKRLEAKQS